MLEKKRLEINQIDKQIGDLLQERYNITKKIGILKQSEKIKITDTNREHDILQKIKTNNYENQAEIITVYNLIMKLSREQQCNLD